MRMVHQKIGRLLSILSVSAILSVSCENRYGTEIEYAESAFDEWLAGASAFLPKLFVPGDTVVYEREDGWRESFRVVRCGKLTTFVVEKEKRIPFTDKVHVYGSTSKVQCFWELVNDSLAIRIELERDSAGAVQTFYIRDKMMRVDAPSRACDADFSLNECLLSNDCGQACLLRKGCGAVRLTSGDGRIWTLLGRKSEMNQD